MIGAVNVSVNLLLCSPCAIDNTAIYINLVDSNPRSFSHVGSCEAHSRLEWLILHGLLTCKVCLSDISTWRPWFRRHSEKIHAHVFFSETKTCSCHARAFAWQNGVEWLLRARYFTSAIASLCPHFLAIATSKYFLTSYLERKRSTLVCLERVDKNPICNY